HVGCAGGNALAALRRALVDEVGEFASNGIQVPAVERHLRVGQLRQQAFLGRVIDSPWIGHGSIESGGAIALLSGTVACCYACPLMAAWLGDFRYAFRSLVRQPTFTAVAILTLVLGIGANTAIFSIVKAVLLNALPYRNPSQIVALWEQNPNGGPDLVAPLTYLDWREQSRSIQSMVAFRQLR